MTNEEINKTLVAVANNTEDCGMLVCLTTIQLLQEIRDLLINLTELDQPVENPSDTIARLHEQGIITDKVLKETQDKDYPDVPNP